MAAFATTDDIEAKWRALTDPEKTSAAEDLDFASAIIRTQVPDIDSRIASQTAPSVLGAVAKGITVAMVLRRLQNPEGWRSQQEAIEDYSVTNTRDSSLSGGAVMLLDGELQLLRGRRKAFSTKPGNEPTTCAIAEQVRINRHRWDVC